MPDPFVLEEAFNVLAGDLIGEGLYRQVFACRIDPTLVIKVEQELGRSSPRFANTIEWDNWGNYLYEDDVKKWLAPCVMISPNGRVLVQKRVEPIPPSQLPKKIPRFLTDIKKENFGYYEGRVVCCDYTMLLTNTRRGVKNARWNLGEQGYE